MGCSPREGCRHGHRAGLDRPACGLTVRAGGRPLSACLPTWARRNLTAVTASRAGPAPAVTVVEHRAEAVAADHPSLEPAARDQDAHLRTGVLGAPQQRPDAQHRARELRHPHLPTRHHPRRVGAANVGPERWSYDGSREAGTRVVQEFDEPATSLRDRPPTGVDQSAADRAGLDGVPPPASVGPGGLVARLATGVVDGRPARSSRRRSRRGGPAPAGCCRRRAPPRGRRRRRSGRRARCPAPAGARGRRRPARAAAGCRR